MLLDAMFDTSKDKTVFESSLQLETEVLEIAAMPLHSICQPGQVWIRTTKINYCSKYVALGCYATRPFQHLYITTVK